MTIGQISWMKLTMKTISIISESSSEGWTKITKIPTLKFRGQMVSSSLAKTRPRLSPTPPTMIWIGKRTLRTNDTILRSIDGPPIPACKDAEVSNILKILKIKKAPFEDGITNRHLRELPDEYVKYITPQIPWSMEKRHCDPNSIGVKETLFPMSLLCCLAKVIEKLVLDRMIVRGTILFWMSNTVSEPRTQPNSKR